MYKGRPRVESRESILNKVSGLCKTKVRNVSDALNVLSVEMTKGGSTAKCADLAVKLWQMVPEDAEKWADGIITTFVDLCDGPENWFAEGRSTTFLLAIHIVAGTVAESKLRLIADYALTKFIPTTEEQMFDHLRIAAIFVQQFNGGREIYPSGPVSLLTRILCNRQSFGFLIPQKITAAAVKLFNELAVFPSVNMILPELCSELPKQPLFREIHEKAEKAMEWRIESHRGQRVFPQVLKMIDPQLEYVPKEKTEEQKLRNQQKKMRKEIRNMEKEINKKKLAEMREARQKRKEEREKTWKQNIAMLEAGRNDDLNMAAAPAHEDDEEEDIPENLFNEEEESSSSSE